jgi:hypothetical protein
MGIQMPARLPRRKPEIAHIPSQLEAPPHVLVTRIGPEGTRRRRRQVPLGAPRQAWSTETSKEEDTGFSKSSFHEAIRDVWLFRRGVLSQHQPAVTCRSHVYSLVITLAPCVGYISCVCSHVAPYGTTGFLPQPLLFRSVTKADHVKGLKDVRRMGRHTER